MNFQDDPGAVFREAASEPPPPPAQLDLDRIVSDGYRARRRHRAFLGGAATAGVAAVAAVLAVSITGLPGGTGETDEDAPDANPPAAEEVTDPSMAGYPYSENWGHLLYGEGYQHESEELMQVKEAATAAFGDLLVDGGVWDDPQNLGEEENCEWILSDPTYGDAAQDEYEQCMAYDSGANVGVDQRPGAYGQTYLRSYRGGEVEEQDQWLRTIFEFEVALPGGWTAEPGPITEQLFPQHLISDGPYFTDEAPEFTTEALDDGRTLMVADHGCAAEVAVVYPNGTGLRVTWNNCSGTDYPLDLDALTEAALAMPELEFDTSSLAPVGELVEVPLGWVYDEDEWAFSDEAEAQAEATYDEALDALVRLYPEATLSNGSSVSLGQMYRGANMQRSYSANGTLPFETTIDESTGDVYFDLRYYLPGGWIPGASDTGFWDPHLTVCKERFECSTEEGDDGETWTFEERTTLYEPQFEEEDWDPYTEHEIYLTRASAEGWAVGIWIQWQDEAPIDRAMLTELLAALPAPEYDADDVPTVPAG
ncbi:hypothetical protein AB0B28_08720 [Glycomyces sp. NPDC046736]|uniref:hypothetical protein n=1 Tax=Glycomyces sp. NPDC046736 TaxID=3155615 RepID=UPI0033CF7967